MDDRKDTPLIGPAARTMLSKAAATIFNPAGVKPSEVKPQNLNNIVQGIKPPEFPKFGNMSSPNLTNASYKPTIPTFNLPDFKSIIPPIKFDK